MLNSIKLKIAVSVVRLRPWAPFPSLKQRLFPTSVPFIRRSGALGSHPVATSHRSSGAHGNAPMIRFPSWARVRMGEIPAAKLFGVGVVLLVVAGCTTTEEDTRQRVALWKGRPVRDFAEYHSMVPEQVFDTPTGRTFIFRRYGPLGSCGITIRGEARPGSADYVIGTVISDCGAQAF